MPANFNDGGSFTLFHATAQGKIKKKYDIDDERAALRAGIDEWLRDGVGDKTFAGGEKPNFADICVFGALKAIDRFGIAIERPCAKAH